MNAEHLFKLMAADPDNYKPGKPANRPHSKGHQWPYEMKRHVLELRDSGHTTREIMRMTGVPIMTQWMWYRAEKRRAKA